MDTDVDISKARLQQPPFLYWLSSEPPPRPQAPNIRVYEEQDHVMDALDGRCWQFADRFPDTPELWRIAYVVDVAPRHYLILCCFDHDFDLAVHAMRGRDFGEPITELLRKEWPLFYKLRKAGLRDEISDGCLFMLPNALDTQWCLGLLVDAGFEITRIEQFREGRVEQAVVRVEFLTYDLMKETYQGVWAIPGWLPIFGGDDLTTRRLKSVQNAIEMFAKGLQLLGG